MIIMICIAITLMSIDVYVLIRGKKHCKYCHDEAVVECITHTDKKVYMCPDCIRMFRFREEECFKSIMPIEYKHKKIGV